MNLLHTLAPPHPVLWPMLYSVLVYGLRYLVMAALTFSVARPVSSGGIGRRVFAGDLGRPHAQAPASMATGRHVRREITFSLLSLLIFGAVNGVLFGWGLMRHSQLYFQFAKFPLWWFVTSIMLALVLHDAFFYWLHRAMHTRLLFGLMHQVHHRSIHPTAFAAYSFHPTEALAEALIVTAILFILPIHPLAVLIFQTISTAYNVYGHCGREFYPLSTAGHWLGRWLNTSSLHAEHHRSGRGNYGLYLSVWDRWLGTATGAVPSKPTAPALV